MGLGRNTTASPDHLHLPENGFKRRIKPMRAESRKRKTTASEASNFTDLTADTPPKKRRSKAARTHAPHNDCLESPEKKGKATEREPCDEEKRQRRWRSHAPSSYQEVRNRALTQRMFVLDRERDILNPEHPVETISLAGSTGNVYSIIVDKIPTCDCPHARKGNQCKHIAYVMTRVLRAPPHLEYQLAFVSSELREIFAHAPPLPSDTAKENEEKNGNRKPLEGDCPICCVDFEPESGEKIVYCRAACGNNIHRACFEQWAATKKGSGNVTCPFCRTPWQGDEDMLRKTAKTGVKNEDGYVNVADQLGISGRRDYSSYHSYWVRREMRNGNILWDADDLDGL